MRNFKFKISNLKFNASGFTLVELMIVIAIISVASIVVLPNIKNIKDEQNLTSAAVEMQTYLRSAQANAASGFGTCSNRQNLGWEVVFTSINNYQIKSICPGIPGPKYPPDPIETQTKSVELAPLSLSISTNDTGANCTFGSLSSSNVLKITFDNITGTVNFVLPQNATCTSSPSQISLLLSPSKSVIIEKGGRIYVSQ